MQCEHVLAVWSHFFHAVDCIRLRADSPVINTLMTKQSYCSDSHSALVITGIQPFIITANTSKSRQYGPDVSMLENQTPYNP